MVQVAHEDLKEAETMELEDIIHSYACKCTLCNIEFKTQNEMCA